MSETYILCFSDFFLYFDDSFINKKSHRSENIYPITWKSGSDLHFIFELFCLISWIYFVKERMTQSDRIIDLILFMFISTCNRYLMVKWFYLCKRLFDGQMSCDYVDYASSATNTLIWLNTRTHLCLWPTFHGLVLYCCLIHVLWRLFDYLMF